jgi:ABC-2 type transport system ATP-binding protein
MAHRLTFSAISKQFGRHTALDSLTLSLEDGEILGFLGPNGAGKTTAIHLALGFLRASSGTGSLLGKPFGDAASRARLGFVPDVPVFFSESGFRSVELAARLNGVNNPRLVKDIRDLLGAVGLSSERKDARQYSRGMQQRLALAQALINDPELLILDEPAAALDPAGVQQVRELLRNARHAGKSIFFSSHQLTEVEHICDRIAFLNQGRLVRCGSLRDFQSESDRVEIELRGISLAELSRIYPAAASDGVNPASIRISIPAQEQRRVIEGIWSAGGEIVSLAPLRRRLEDLFLEWSGVVGAIERAAVDLAAEGERSHS